MFKLLRFEKRFRKAPFSWRNSVDGTVVPKTALLSSSHIYFQNDSKRFTSVSFVFLAKFLWRMSGKPFSQLILKLQPRWLANTWSERLTLRQQTSWSLGPKLRQRFWSRGCRVEVSEDWAPNRNKVALIDWFKIGFILLQHSNSPVFLYYFHNWKIFLEGKPESSTVNSS